MLLIHPKAELGPPDVVLWEDTGDPHFSPGLQHRRASLDIARGGGGGAEEEPEVTASYTGVAFLRSHTPSRQCLMCPLPPISCSV